MAFFRRRTVLQLEILALNDQLGVLQRSVNRPQLTAADRFLWGWLSVRSEELRSSAASMTLATSIGWYRKGFGLFWPFSARGGDRGDRQSQQRRPVLDSHDEPCQTSLLRTTDSRRIESEQVQVPPPQNRDRRLRRPSATITSRRWFRSTKFFDCCRRAPPDHPLCRDRSSHGGVDHTAAQRSLSIEHRSLLIAAQFRLDRRERFFVGTGFPLAKRPEALPAADFKRVKSADTRSKTRKAMESVRSHAKARLPRTTGNPAATGCAVGALSSHYQLDPASIV